MYKKIIVILFLFLCTNNIYAQKKLNIAILDLKAGVGRTQSQIDGLADMLTVELYNSGQFIIKERIQVEQIVKELQLQKSNLSNDQRKELGDRLQVQAILIGTINFQVRERTLEDVATDMAKGEYNIDIRLIDIDTGEILSAAGGNVPGTRTERSVMNQIAQELAENLKTSARSDEVFILYDYLYVFPDDIGKFLSCPNNVISAINKKNTHGFNDWRLPTNEELSLMISNRQELGLLSNAVYASINQFDNINPYSVRLVRTEVLVQEQDNKPEVNPYIENTTYDLGTISVLSGSATAAFIIQNPTKDMLYITNVKSPSSDLIVNWTSHGIAPGESGRITVKIGTNGRQGVTINKSLTATLSNGHKLTMYIKGSIK